MGELKNKIQNPKQNKINKIKVEDGKRSRMACAVGIMDGKTATSRYIIKVKVAN